MINGKKIIALCTSRIYDSQQHSYIKKLNKRLNDLDMRLFIYTLNMDLYWNEDTTNSEAGVFDLIPYDRIDAVVLMDEKIKSRTVSSSIIAQARFNSVPVIVVDAEYEGSTNVYYNYTAGFEKVVRHVIEDHGVTRSHFMAGIRNNHFSDERLNCYKKVLKENGLPFDESMVSYGEFWAVPTREAMRKLLERDELPQAIICANDIMAINVMDVLTEANIRIPEDIIVTGFDGILEGDICSPTLTTASCSSTQLANAVTKAITSRLNGEKCENIAVVPEFMPKRSCGCAGCPSDDNVTNSFNIGFYRYEDDMRVLYEMSVKMQLSESIESAVHCMRGDKTEEMCCIISKNCLLTDRNFFLEDTEMDMSDMCVIYDSYHYPDEIKDFDAENIAPGIESLIESHYPLIFNILDYLNKPFGYTVFSYHRYDITEYSKSASVTNTLNLGLGGLMTLRYQRFLSSKIAQMYLNDNLTGLYNRQGFKAVIDSELEKPVNFGKQLTVLMLDIDGLKYINDNHGHDAGDKAIAKGASALKEACPPDAYCVRFGGDEMFALIIGECNSDTIISQINSILEESSKNEEFEIKASCGAFSQPITQGMDLNSVIKRADEQMYEIKKARKQHK
ncbi:GGDEF domain-containing protein [Ruminococcus albus]|uniref:Diguanylate cyclase (GGDEF) domain-containing protein n=1 Tax=Ruminococcus albus TaxID=1264 RepID=A0A1I1FA14_RUMAL|nr:GGDEF domain-containing protein [Ruminococcus albus]SFB95796.1 diguanylate cyclase (GGDEF) domain-containing protein [Ruminococcus albus]